MIRKKRETPVNPASPPPDAIIKMAAEAEAESNPVQDDQDLVTPLGMPLNGAQILDETNAFVSRYVAFPSAHCAPVVALWAAHTHAEEGTWYTTPRLNIESVEPGSGKTRVLELLGFLGDGTQMIANITPATIYRLVDSRKSTLLIDEVDALFAPRAGGDKEDIRSLLNLGYKRGATIPRNERNEKGNFETRDFRIFAPVALAGIGGRVPQTLTSRSVTIRMRKRGPEEHVERFRTRRVEVEAIPLREALHLWMKAVSGALEDPEPVVPDGVEDRAEEVWEPLLAIAEEAGGHWPETARAACLHFTAPSEENLSPGLRLLQDLRTVFTESGDDCMATTNIIERLKEVEESPWKDYLYGKPIDARWLSDKLRGYGVTRDTFRVGPKTFKGYRTNPHPGSVGLSDAWKRYLPDPAEEVSSPVSPQVGNSGNPSNTAGQVGRRPVTDQDHVTDHREHRPVESPGKRNGSRKSRINPGEPALSLPRIPDHEVGTEREYA